MAGTHPSPLFFPLPPLLIFGARCLCSAVAGGYVARAFSPARFLELVSTYRRGGLMAHRPVRSRIPFLVAIVFALGVAPSRALSAARAKWALAPTVAGAPSAGDATPAARPLRNGVSSTPTRGVR